MANYSQLKIVITATLLAAAGGQTTETPYQQYSIHYDPTNQRLNWDPEILWATADYPDQYYVEVMDEIYLPPSQSYNGQRLMDVTKFVYSYKTMDIEAAARDKGNREKYIQEEKVPVYPDTTVWIKDFNYSYNEPMHNDYFWHAAYDDYPVVGVTWTQAKAFCDWRTQFHNGYRKSKGLLFWLAISAKILISVCVPKDQPVGASTAFSER